MTEAEWLASDDPLKMLKFTTGKLSERQLRLFACACCRRIWHLLPDQSWEKNLIEITERYLIGKASESEQRQARGPGFEVYSQFVRDADRLESPLRASVVGAVGAAGFLIDDEPPYRILIGESPVSLIPLEAAREAARCAVQALSDWIHEMDDQSVDELDDRVVTRAVEESRFRESRAQCELLRDIAKIDLYATGGSADSIG